jgi:alkyl hydroperoxide reductase subunit F
VADGEEKLSFDTGFALPEERRGGAPDSKRLYDIIIVGGGPAALSAAVYIMRKGLDMALLTGNIGGQVTWTNSIENYLGYRLVDGPTLVRKFNEQIGTFPIALGTNMEARSAAAQGGVFTVATGGGTFRARALILATGKRPQTLDVPGEKELLGHGVAYCAICDAPLYKGKRTAVVGGGNSGLEAAIDLARGCPKVYVVERAPVLTGDEILRKNLEARENVEIRTGTAVTAIKGREKVEGLEVEEVEGGKSEELDVEGVFVEVGLHPNSEPFQGFVDLNERGEVNVDYRGCTSRPGVFAAGDVTSVPYKQIVIAAGDGAKAALSAYEYVLKKGQTVRPVKEAVDGDVQ